jgi:hypothetical protein
MAIIEFDEECESCRGTGLYIGMVEIDGAAIVCHNCKGTGCNHFKHEYKTFTERKNTDKVKRVYQLNPGIMIVEDDGCMLEQFGGITYENWKLGAEFLPGTENRKHTCPAHWYQNVDYEKIPEWEECVPLGKFSNCKEFPTKEKCWKRWDKEFGEK